MSILEQVYASGGDILIYTLELACDAWESSVFICGGFENQTCTDENGRVVTFEAAGIDVALPKKGNSGAQTLTFAIDNITGEAQRKVDQALAADERVTLFSRIFLASDLGAPAEPPYRMTVMGGSMQGTTLQIQAGYFDLINTAWPRDLYTLEFAPGLKYL